MRRSGVLTGSAIALAVTVMAAVAPASVWRPNVALAREAGPTAESGPTGPVDYGFGPGVRPGSLTQKLRSAGKAALRALSGGSAVVGAPDAHVTGAFGPPFFYPINPLHSVLLPDGRVLSYGTDEQGQQTGLFVYALWDPSLGSGPDAFTVLPNTTGTDLFCSGQTVVAATGKVFLAGGDETVGGVRNYSSADTNLFDPATNTLRPERPMRWKRWYPTLVTLSTGNVLVLGGRDRPGGAVTTPELYRPGSTWRVITGAASTEAFGKPYSNWFYPRAFLTPGGSVGVLGNDGATFLLQTAGPTGTGSIVRQAAVAPAGHYALPALMYAPGRVLSLREGRQVALVNFSGTTPRVSSTGRVSAVRYWSNATVMAEGSVVVTGGSGVDTSITTSSLDSVTYHAEIWSPGAGSWTRGASAVKPRLYHSIALLLPDATVLTAGGGSPGPVTNLNAEIYYPPHLFKRDGSGELAARPTIVSAPRTIPRTATFGVEVGAGQTIGRVTLLRTGSVTHAFDADQRRIDLGFQQTGNRLTVSGPGAATTAPPGYYMLFVLDPQAVPSVARIVGVGI